MIGNYLCLLWTDVQCIHGCVPHCCYQRVLNILWWSHLACVSYALISAHFHVNKQHTDQIPANVPFLKIYCFNQDQPFVIGSYRPSPGYSWLMLVHFNSSGIESTIETSPTYCSLPFIFSFLRETKLQAHHYERKLKSLHCLFRQV